MPNFAYTNTTQFKPFSFEEQLRPLLMYTQAHQAVEEAYSELDSQANAIGSLANETNDPITYARYKSFEASLRNQADILAKNGLTPGSRKSLLDLKGRYAKEITPIQNAITRRRELADEQRKALLQNPTLMFQRDMNSISYDSSLDRFLENPDYDYGEQYSGALITKQVSDMASHLAKELRGTASGRLDDYTKTFMKKYGLSSEEVLSAIMNPNDPRGSRALNAIYDSAVSSVPKAIRDQYADNIRHYATQGFWSAIGQNQISPYEDYGARKPQVKGITLNSRSVYSKRHRSQAEAAFNSNKKNFGQYFDNIDGKYVLNDKGKAELARNATPRVTIAGSGSGTAMLMNAETQYQTPSRFIPTEFKKFMDSLGMTNANDAGSLWDKYMNDPIATTAGYDAKKYTEYPHRISPSEQEIWKDNLLMTAVNGKLKEVDFDSKTGQYKETGETLSVEDLNKEGYEVLEVVMSNLGPKGRGNTTTIRDDTGHVKTYRLEPGINEPNEEAITSYLNYASQLEQIPDEGGYIQDKYGRPVFITRDEAEAEHDMILQLAKTHLSQLGLANKTKPQEFNSYTW